MRYVGHVNHIFLRGCLILEFLIQEVMGLQF